MFRGAVARRDDGSARVAHLVDLWEEVETWLSSLAHDEETGCGRQLVVGDQVLYRVGDPLLVRLKRGFFKFLIV